MAEEIKQEENKNIQEINQQKEDKLESSASTSTLTQSQAKPKPKIVRQEIPSFSIKPEKTNNSAPSEKSKKNPWMIATFVFGILFIILLISNFSDNKSLTGRTVSGDVISEEAAGNIVLEIANKQIGNSELIGVNEISGIYEVMLFINNEEVPVYITKDGKNLIGLLTPVDLIIDSINSRPTQVPVSELEGVDFNEVFGNDSLNAS